MIDQDLQDLAGMAKRKRVARNTIRKRLGKGCWAAYEKPRQLTFFHDAHTSGVRAPPTEYDDIVIWGHRTAAIERFIDEFGISPEKTGCPCCGPIYSVQTFTEPEVTDSSYLSGIYDRSVILGEPDDFSL